MSRLTAFVVCAAVTFLGGAQASADPVRITGGTLLVTGLFETAPIAIVGSQGFSLDAIAAPSEGRVDPFSQCESCVPGTSISLGGNLSGAFEGLVTFEGNTFPLVISTAAETIMFFEWDGVTTAPPPGNGPVSLTEHFAMTGRLLNQGVKLTDIIGAGTATLFLDPLDFDSGFAWEVNRVRYDFENAAAPEPATMTLLATGVLVGGLRRHIRRRTV